jgi:hypothetical protein
MKTLDALLVAVFVSLVAYAAITHTPLPILAAAIVAALLIGQADESAPIYRYVPGQRNSSNVDTDIAFVARQIRLWQFYLLICIVAMITTATFLVFVIKDGRWPGDWVSIPLGLQHQGIVLGLTVGLLMLYCLTISVGCIQPLEQVLNHLYNEYNVCLHAERSREATIGNPDWHSCNQLDWDHSPIARAARRRNQEDGTARPPYNGSY